MRIKNSIHVSYQEDGGGHNLNQRLNYLRIEGFGGVRLNDIRDGHGPRASLVQEEEVEIAV